MDQSTISFIDGDSGDQALVIVRLGAGCVGLAASLESNGDIEVFLDLDAVDALIASLSAARAELAADKA